VFNSGRVNRFSLQDRARERSIGAVGLTVGQGLAETLPTGGF
jgi:hypothetical protein